VLVPVPLHPRRAAQRGFNQSLLLAHAASELLGLDVSDCLVRTRDTAPQVRLSIGERLDNLHGAFTGMGHAPPWAILVDDVCTTGATLSAAARALRACGSRRVDAAVLCRG
jgi:predicted amidophosphoribosyltransferase